MEWDLKILQGRINWTIGNGESVRMGLDPWVPGLLNGVPTLKLELEHGDKKDWRVKNLILTNNSCAWNYDLICELFNPHYACIIFSLPFPLCLFLIAVCGLILIVVLFR